MSTSSNPRREHPSTYVVQDRSSQEELTRLQIQDQMLTASMGGVLPEQPDLTLFHRVLDVGCGTGGWLIEAAKSSPDLSLLVGIDVSTKMIEAARTQAKAEQVDDRVEFHQMDALRLLEFPNGYFDLVNQRLGQSWLRTWDWPKLLQEYRRITRWKGVIRVTESGVTETSPALTRFSNLVLAALYQAGHYFTPDWNGVTSQLARLLHQHAGLQEVQTQAHALEYRAGTPQGRHYAEDVRHTMKTLLPFLRKWTQVPEDYEALCAQVLSELEQPDFVATLRSLTAWGRTSL